MFGRALHDLNRLRQIAAAMARHGFGAYLERMRLRDVLGREAPPAGDPLPSADRATAARFRQMLAELGPTFIKLGQKFPPDRRAEPHHRDGPGGGRPEAAQQPGAEGRLPGCVALGHRAPPHSLAKNSRKYTGASGK